MKAGTSRIALLAVAAAVAISGTAVAPAAAWARIPEEPDLRIGVRAKPRPARVKRPARAIVALGWSERHGLVLYAPVGGGVPMG